MEELDLFLPKKLPIETKGCRERMQATRSAVKRATWDA
jgi:hypothetical protein